MKIVGFVGSPRKKGNTTSIVNEVCGVRPRPVRKQRYLISTNWASGDARLVSSARHRKENVYRPTAWRHFMKKFQCRCRCAWHPGLHVSNHGPDEDFYRPAFCPVVSQRWQTRRVQEQNKREKGSNRVFPESTGNRRVCIIVRFKRRRP